MRIRAVHFFAGEFAPGHGSPGESAVVLPAHIARTRAFSALVCLSHRMVCRRPVFYRYAARAMLANKRRMSHLQEQLAALRLRMARTLEECVEKYEKPDSTGVASTSAPRRFHLHEWLPGQEMETEQGKHFETETFYANHRRHGSADIGSLGDLPGDLLTTLSAGAIADVPPDQWAFLDTETTGLAGGTGTCAFLVGVGRITPEGFRVRQFFMRDYGEEASVLAALTRHLEQFRVLITYNGRSFDQPLLETRYRMNRARPPFARFEHLDLLYGARRLWKLRFESCRLVDLEQQILGFERHGDVAGALIPYVYFEYVRTGEMARLLPVFHHNATDILTLACLTGIVPYAFNDPAGAFLNSAAPPRHGAEMAGIARWLRQAGELEQAAALFRRAMETNLADDLLFRTLWDLAAIEKKLGNDSAALEVWNDLAGSKNPFQARAYEELAKHYEHCKKNPERALAMTRGAQALDDTAELRKREERLLQRLRPPGAARVPRTNTRSTNATPRRRTAGPARGLPAIAPSS